MLCLCVLVKNNSALTQRTLTPLDEFRRASDADKRWFSLTRLETRTKESNSRASIWVFETLMLNESECVGMASASVPVTTGQQIACEMLSKSMCVGTRKMVNYA